MIATKHLFAGETRIASKIDADYYQRPPVLYYHPDHLGSTQYVTDQDQALSQHVEYLPSGELWADQTDSRYQNRQPYLFNGKELDLSTGLYHYGARSYEPRLGVWLSPDPILDQYMRGAPSGGVYRPINLGLYTYTSNNPVVLVDPTGKFDDATRKFIATALAAAALEPTPVGEIVVAGALVVGSIGYAGYLIFDAAANGDPPKPPESFPIPEDTPDHVAAPPLPPAAGGGGDKQPPKPPAPPEAQPPGERRTPGGGGDRARDDANGGVRLTGAGRKVLQDPALRQMKDKTLREEILARGGGGGVVRKAGDLADRTIGELANAAAQGDGAAVKAIKLLKDAARLGGKNHGQ
ncbi:RHS repeat-associated core domain-containing protein [Sorangium sp. So ce726]|uniref:RHS repeat domain-containing protein n=1 Tax=Sorangium sp. So ce726 TaxID=3133319 RepID=UPI003F5E5796